MSSTRKGRVIALASGTMASRVTGFLRTLVAAYVLGFTPFADAFNLANTLPNSLYDLIIGGVVSATFVTVFTHRLTVDGDRKAWRSISTVTSFTLLLLVVTSLLVWVCAPY
ncbi:MAG: murein biosynthesis integral membrane protein MurJ, partial [Acidobacteria bacterium]|nr:murein biosynthesis integral membrane protein MurJ [Acidobacteriota bacterium]